MSEMVERVATLLYAEFAHPPREGEDLTARCERVALTAIEAMREPTEEMCMAALVADREISSDSVAGNPARWKRPSWQAMIDAALNPDRTL